MFKTKMRICFDVEFRAKTATPKNDFEILQIAKNAVMKDKRVISVCSDNASSKSIKLLEFAEDKEYNKVLLEKKNLTRIKKQQDLRRKNQKR